MTFPSDPFAPGVGVHERPAVFQAEYTNVAVVRKGVRVTFEVPIEAKDLVMDVLGGLPPGDGSVRVAIARLNERE